MKKRNIVLESLSIVAMVAMALVVTNVISPLFAIPGMALALNPFFVFQVSKQIEGARAAAMAGQPLELQYQPLWSYVTLPAALNAAGGINFFGDAEATVGTQRTNLTRPNQVPNGTNYEVHGIRIIFSSVPVTVLWTSFITALRDAYLVFKVGTSDRLKLHGRSFLPSTIYAPSVSAAAGDNPVLTEQGYEAVIQLILPIPLADQTNFGVNMVFTTDVAALGNTVMGVQLEGLIDRGNIKPDQSPVRSLSSLGI